MLNYVFKFTNGGITEISGETWESIFAQAQRRAQYANTEIDRWYENNWF